MKNSCAFQWWVVDLYGNSIALVVHTVDHSLWDLLSPWDLYQDFLSPSLTSRSVVDRSLFSRLIYPLS